MNTLGIISAQGTPSTSGDGRVCARCKWGENCEWGSPNNLTPHINCKHPTIEDRAEVNASNSPVAALLQIMGESATFKASVITRLDDTCEFWEAR